MDELPAPAWTRIADRRERDRAWAKWLLGDLERLGYYRSGIKQVRATLQHFGYIDRDQEEPTPAAAQPKQLSLI